MTEIRSGKNQIRISRQSLPNGLSQTRHLCHGHTKQKGSQQASNSTRAHSELVACSKCHSCAKSTFQSVPSEVQHGLPQTWESSSPPNDCSACLFTGITHSPALKNNCAEDRNMLLAAQLCNFLCLGCPRATEACHASALLMTGPYRLI
jgi:hypothetical protein